MSDEDDWDRYQLGWSSRAGVADTSWVLWSPTPGFLRIRSKRTILTHSQMEGRRSRAAQRVGTAL
jgi:hypothetical protein